MTICPKCGHNFEDYFLEYYCKCGCGIGCKKTDPDAEKKIEEWKKEHVCKVTK
jgi:hypothetical protein